MKAALPKGTYVPLVTPFTPQGKIDIKSLDTVIERLLKANVEAVVVLGTTGESPTVNSEESVALIRHTIARMQGDTAVIAGIGTNDTASSLEQAKVARDLGVDGLLVVCPYYSKPTQKGLFDHFKLIAEQVPVPQIVYNIAGRTGINIEADTLFKLSQLQNIVGVKESSDNIDQASQLLQLLDDEFLVLCGCDHLNFSMLCLGGHGVISTVANVIPEKVKALVDAVHCDDIQTARQLHFAIEPLVTGCSMETNPIPIKTALAMMGEIREVFRPPLCTMTPHNRSRLSTVLEQIDLINQSIR